MSTHVGTFIVVWNITRARSNMLFLTCWVVWSLRTVREDLSLQASMNTQQISKKKHYHVYGLCWTREQTNKQTKQMFQHEWTTNRECAIMCIYIYIHIYIYFSLSLPLSLFVYVWSVCAYIYMYVCLYTLVYIYRERRRDGERGRDIFIGTRHRQYWIQSL